MLSLRNGFVFVLASSTGTRIRHLWVREVSTILDLTRVHMSIPGIPRIAAAVSVCSLTHSASRYTHNLVTHVHKSFTNRGLTSCLSGCGFYPFKHVLTISPHPVSISTAPIATRAHRCQNTQTIQRKRKEFLDPQSRNNMARLNDDLADIHSIMKQNIEEVLNRGEKLDREWNSLACFEWDAIAATAVVGHDPVFRCCWCWCCGRHGVFFRMFGSLAVMLSMLMIRLVLWAMAKDRVVAIKCVCLVAAVVHVIAEGIVLHGVAIYRGYVTGAVEAYNSVRVRVTLPSLVRSSSANISPCVFGARACNVVVRPRVLFLYFPYMIISAGLAL